MNHREILLYGFHFSFFLVFTMAVIRDIYFGNYFNASINFTSFCLTCISYYLLHFRSKVDIASYIIMFIAIVPLYILIYFNHFDNMVIVYVILLPIAAFFLLEFKKALTVNLFMYILLVSMLYYIASVNPQAPIVNNPLALINIAFASIFIMFFGIFYHLAIDSSLSALIHSNRQKDILLKEVHHRVKNNLNVIASILGLQSLGKSKETQNELATSKARIESIAIVHEMLYKQDDFEQIHFYDYVTKLKNLILSMQTQSNETTIILKNSQITLPLDTMIQLGLVINELFTNTIKYAKNAQGLTITLTLDKKEDIYTFTYQDNGTTPIDTQTILMNNSLGMKLIHLSVKQLNGTLELLYKNGLCYTILFKGSSS